MQHQSTMRFRDIFPFLSLFSLLFFSHGNASLVNASRNSTLNKSLGINCRGSSLCPSQDLTNDYIGIILDIALGLAKCDPQLTLNCGPMNGTDIYKPGTHIICLPQGKSFLGGICAFTQGNVAVLGIFGFLIKRKLRQLSDHGCQV